MDFKFSWLVELLQALDKARYLKALPAARSLDPDLVAVTQWFNRYGSKLAKSGALGNAFLACIFPEKTQGGPPIEERRLAAVFGRALGFNAAQVQQLNAWRESNSGFAACFEKVMVEDDRPAGEVALLEVDAISKQLIANHTRRPDEILAPALNRMSTSEIKWLVQMILRSYSPVQIPEKIVMRNFEFRVPYLNIESLNLGASSVPEVTKLLPILESKGSAFAVRYGPTVFLSRSLFTERQEVVISRIHAKLRNHDLVATLSKSGFVKSLLRTSVELHLVLADTSRPKVTAKDVLRTGMALVKHQDVETGAERRSIIFVDQAAFFRVGLTATDENWLREAFIAGIEFGPDIINKKGTRRAAKAFWSWRASELKLDVNGKHSTATGFSNWCF
jgi:hypothetical protein